MTPLLQIPHARWHRQDSVLGQTRCNQRQHVAPPPVSLGSATKCNALAGTVTSTTAPSTRQQPTAYGAMLRLSSSASALPPLPQSHPIPTPSAACCGRCSPAGSCGMASAKRRFEPSCIAASGRLSRIFLRSACARCCKSAGRNCPQSGLRLLKFCTVSREARACLTCSSQNQVQDRCCVIRRRRKARILTRWSGRKARKL